MKTIITKIQILQGSIPPLVLYCILIPSQFMVLKIMIKNNLRKKEFILVYGSRDIKRLCISESSKQTVGLASRIEYRNLTSGTASMKQKKQIGSRQGFLFSRPTYSDRNFPTRLHLINFHKHCHPLCTKYSIISPQREHFHSNHYSRHNYHRYKYHCTVLFIVY